MAEDDATHEIGVAAVVRVGLGQAVARPETVVYQGLKLGAGEHVGGHNEDLHTLPLRGTRLMVAGGGRPAGEWGNP